MDGKDRWIFVERLWRRVKYEAVYFKAYESIIEAELSLGDYFVFYNVQRHHQGLDYDTPDKVYLS